MAGYTTHKRFGPYSVVHRNQHAESHCRFLHGYGRMVEIAFEAVELDARGWVIDFGGLGKIKEWFEDNWDHKLLLSADDPLVPLFENMPGEYFDLNVHWKGYSGIEGQARWVAEDVDKMLNNDELGQETQGRVVVHSVTVYEHENNFATYHPNGVL